MIPRPVQEVHVHDLYDASKHLLRNVLETCLKLPYLEYWVPQHPSQATLPNKYLKETREEEESAQL